MPYTVTITAEAKRQVSSLSAREQRIVILIAGLLCGWLHLRADHVADTRLAEDRLRRRLSPRPAPPGRTRPVRRRTRGPVPCAGSPGCVEARPTAGQGEELHPDSS